MTDITVFSVLRESECSECGTEIFRRALLRMENGKPLCMACADLDNLVWLPRGDAALTRRAGKYSTLKAVIVRFSRARKRYERQGILVEEDALERAEAECLADAEARSRARERAALRRTDEDEDYMAAFAKRIGEFYPASPRKERLQIARHTCRRSSGRVGRSAAARELEEVGHRSGSTRPCPARAQPLRRVDGRGSGQTGRSCGGGCRCRRRSASMARRRARLVGDALVASRADRTKAFRRRARPYQERATTRVAPTARLSTWEPRRASRVAPVVRRRHGDTPADPPAGRRVPYRWR